MYMYLCTLLTVHVVCWSYCIYTMYMYAVAIPPLLTPLSPQMKVKCSWVWLSRDSLSPSLDCLTFRMPALSSPTSKPPTLPSSRTSMGETSSHSELYMYIHLLTHLHVHVHVYTYTYISVPMYWTFDVCIMCMYSPTCTCCICVNVSMYNCWKWVKF